MAHLAESLEEGGTPGRGICAPPIGSGSPYPTRAVQPHARCSFPPCAHVRPRNPTQPETNRPGRDLHLLHYPGLGRPAVCGRRHDHPDKIDQDSALARSRHLRAHSGSRSTCDTCPNTREQPPLPPRIACQPPSAARCPSPRQSTISQVLVGHGEAPRKPSAVPLLTRPLGRQARPAEKPRPGTQDTASKLIHGALKLCPVPDPENPPPTPNNSGQSTS